MIDTNVLIDLVSSGRPAHEDAVSAVRALLAADGFDGCVLSSSLKDVYYVYCRHYGDEPAARGAIRELRRMFALVNLTAEIVDDALGSDERDFEDGLLRAAAELSGCDYLLTRDAPGFHSAKFKKVDAPGLLGILSRARG